MNKSLYGSKLEQRRGYYLKLCKVTFQQQVQTKISFRGVNVTNYKWDFVYLLGGNKIYEETKGYFHESDKLRFKFACAEILSEQNTEVWLVTERKPHDFIVKKITIEKGKYYQTINGKRGSLRWNDTSSETIKKKRSRKLSIF
jgi:hypothetical protein